MVLSLWPAKWFLGWWAVASIPLVARSPVRYEWYGGSPKKKGDPPNHDNDRLEGITVVGCLKSKAFEPQQKKSLKANFGFRGKKADFPPHCVKMLR